ncbi:MAG TPA: tRNA (guanosine(37)-N1)-methyltransferase TrmD [Actinomycetota bacterium]|nr:tRNA (guanosine(37)-N1)-methyltransferase TrmD [Actinomycetota bacterium]
MSAFDPGSGTDAGSGPALRVDVLTLFPGIFESPLRESLLGRAIHQRRIAVSIHDIRDHTHDRAHQVDDYSFGGGPGMVMKPEPIFEAVESLGPGEKRIILLSAAGKRLDQPLVNELSAEPWLVLICGRYEGVDERVITGLAAEEISIGDFVLAGGEVAALVLLEAVSRRIRGVVGNEESLAPESFETGILDHPHYTRPRVFRGMEVPDVLLSGDHRRIAEWRRQAALDKTRKNRPDLLERPEASTAGG